MDVWLCWVFCVFTYRSLVRAHDLFRGVPTEWCVWEWSGNLTLRRLRTFWAVEPFKQTKLTLKSPMWPFPSRIFRLKFNTRTSYASCNYKQMSDNIAVSPVYIYIYIYIYIYRPNIFIFRVTPEWKSRRLPPSLVVFQCERMAWQVEVVSATNSDRISR
jgi:hypothetical protein